MSLYPDILDLIESYARETLSECKFAANWVKMSIDEKNELRHSLDLPSNIPFSHVKGEWLAISRNEPKSQVLESLLNYALLNTVPDYNEDMYFFYEKDKTVYIARSEDIASIMMGISIQISDNAVDLPDIMEEASFNLSQLYDRFLEYFTENYKSKPVEFTKVTNEYKIVTPSTIFQSLVDNSKSINGEEE